MPTSITVLYEFALWNFSLFQLPHKDMFIHGALSPEVKAASTAWSFILKPHTYFHSIVFNNTAALLIIFYVFMQNLQQQKHISLHI
jgi:hypothetical protein